MIDYELKSKVLNSGLCKLEKKVSKAMFKFYQYHNKGSDLTDLSYNSAVKIYNYQIRHNNLYWKEAQKINHATYSRARRLKERIELMLAFDKCQFLTLTFTDEVLASTSENTRRRYVTRFLKSLNCDNYVANKDFGGENGREHYHAVVSKDYIDYSSWSYGNLDGEVCNKNSKALSKYVAKLTNHAIKETTKRSSLIYCRSFKLEKMAVI